MDGDDVVDLVIVTKQSNFLAVAMTRQAASDWIKHWFDARECVRNMSWWKMLWGYLKAFPNWLRPYTFVFNAITPNGNFGYWAVDVRYIVGMYTKERPPDYNKTLAEYQTKMVAAQSKIADAMMRGMGEGEEWRNGPKDEGEG